MKSKEEILKRAIVLLAFSDRCAIEKKTVDGVKRSLTERETQRKAIFSWLQRMGYYESACEREKEIFNKEITEKTDEEILLMQSEYECLEPLLWSIGLISELSDYNDFVLRDFHPILGFGKNHSFEALAEGCRTVSEAEINVRREMAMLWYWRCIEGRNNPNESFNVKKAVGDIFGENIAYLLSECGQFDAAVNDFTVNGKSIADLTDAENEKLSVISERRFRAFEWIAADSEWDNIDPVC